MHYTKKSSGSRSNWFYIWPAMSTWAIVANSHYLNHRLHPARRPKMLLLTDSILLLFLPPSLCHHILISHEYRWTRRCVLRSGIIVSEGCLLIWSFVLHSQHIYRKNICSSMHRNHGPLARYVKLRVAHAPGTFSPPSRISDTDMHHGTCVTHVPWCMPGSQTSGFLWSRWRGKRSGHSQRMHNLQFYVSGNCNNMTHSFMTKAYSYFVHWSWKLNGIYPLPYLNKMSCKQKQTFCTFCIDLFKTYHFVHCFKSCDQGLSQREKKSYMKPHLL